MLEIRNLHVNVADKPILKGLDLTVNAGEVFYESPTDVHIVSRNASATQTAKLLVFYVKVKGAPPTVLVGHGHK